MITTEQRALVTIGIVEKDGERRVIRLAPEYAAGVTGLEGFSHVMVIWWAEKFEEYRHAVDMVIDLPYAAGVRAGLFATRSPVRPNPVCVNTCRILAVDPQAGTIDVDEIDAYEGTHVLDIKPYYGCIDRVKEYSQPEWVPAEWGAWYAPLPVVDYGSE